MIYSAVYRFLANLDIFALYPIDHDTYSAAGLVYAGDQVTSEVYGKVMIEGLPALQACRTVNQFLTLIGSVRGGRSVQFVLSVDTGAMDLTEMPNIDGGHGATGLSEATSLKPKPRRKFDE